jgi:hypothetical protein
MKVSRLNICSYGPQIMMENHQTAPQLQNQQTCGTLEDPQIYFAKLLVAQHVTLHQSVLQSVRYVPSDEGPKAQAIQQTTPPAHA